MATRLTCAAKTDVGLKRTNNEDNLVMVPSQGLYVLADGMGGHASGQVASTMCVSHVAQFICEISKKPGFEFPYPPNNAVSYEANLLINAIKFANERIFIQSCKDRAMEGMGTTVTAIYNTPRGLVLAHVGDSRIYRIRNGQITQMSRDHSLINHLIDKGELKPEDASKFPQKNIILRAIGLKDYVDVDVKEVPRVQGDVYLMCSDGLSDLVPDQLIAQTVTAAPNLNEACNALIGHALKAGGKDNVTVVCVCVEQEDGSQSQPPMQQMRPGQNGIITSVPNIPPLPPKPGQPMPPQRPGQTPPLSRQAPPPSFVPPQPPPQPMGATPPSNSSHPAMGAMQQPFPANAPGVPMQQPKVRMHSVREIVEPKPSPRPMPKPIGSAGRSMPAVPGMGKVKPASAEQPETAPTTPAPQNIPPTPSNPPMMPPAAQTKPSPEPTSPTQPQQVNQDPAQVGPTSNSDSDSSKLLFSAPPEPAPVNDHEDSFEDDEDDDLSKTMIECPIISFPPIAASSTSNASTGSTNPNAQSGHPALTPTPDTGNTPNYDKPSRPYVAPESARRKPKVESGGIEIGNDSIEIGNILFGDADDEEVTSVFRKPDFSKK